MKTCSSCTAQKPLSDFGKHSQTKDGLKSRCKACNAAEARQYAAANSDKVKASRAAAYRANPEAVKARSSAYFHGNKEKALAARKRYHAAHPEVARHVSRNRRAMKRSAGGQLSRNIEQVLAVAQKYRCINCRANLRKTGWHLDHIEPLSKGGWHDDSNVQLLCPTCNLSKHAKDPITWAQANGRLL